MALPHLPVEFLCKFIRVILNDFIRFRFAAAEFLCVPISGWNFVVRLPNACKYGDGSVDDTIGTPFNVLI